MGMVMDLYVVTQGDRDEERTVGVFTSLKEVQKVVPAFDGDMSEIEVWYGMASKPCEHSHDGRDGLHIQIRRLRANEPVIWETDYWGVSVKRNEIQKWRGY